MLGPVLGPVLGGTAPGVPARLFFRAAIRSRIAATSRSVVSWAGVALPASVPASPKARVAERVRGVCGAGDAAPGAGAGGMAGVAE